MIAVGEHFVRDAHLNVQLPGDDADAKDLYERCPIVTELVNRYANRNDCSVHEILTESAGEFIGVPARQLGYQHHVELDRAQKLLKEQFQLNVAVSEDHAEDSR